MTRRGRTWVGIGVAVLIAASMTMVAVLSLRLADHGSWLTGPHRVRWFDSAGAPFDGVSTACDSDPRLQSLRDGDRLWFSCGPIARVAPYGGLASIDFGTGVGRVSWPFPGAHPAQWLIGVARAPGGLAVAYQGRSGDVIVAGVAGPDGWIVAPAPLDEKPDARLIGLAASGDAVEALFQSAPQLGAPPPPVVVVRLASGAAPTRRTVERTAAMGPLEEASIAAAYRRPGENGWRFLVIGRATGDAALALWDVPEGKAPERTARNPETVWGERLDASAAGLLVADAAAVRTVLGADGSLTDPPPAPAAMAESIRLAGHYAMEGDRLGLVDLRLVRRPSGPGFIWSIGGRSIEPALEKAEGDEVVTLDDAANAARPVSVARADAMASALGRSGMLAPIESGGFRLFAASGRHLRVDGELRRTDPLTVAEHLRTRGSRVAGGSERRHALGIFWIYVGPLLAAGIAYPIARVRSRRSYLPILEEILVPAAVAFGVHLLSAAVLLSRLWSILR